MKTRIIKLLVQTDIWRAVRIPIQDTDFDSSKQDPNAHSLWLHVRMFLFFFVYFSKRKLRLFYERMSTLPTIPIPQGKGGLTLCKAPSPALVSFPSWTPESLAACSWPQEALQNFTWKDQSEDLHKWSRSTHYKQCSTPVHKTQ